MPKYCTAVLLAAVAVTLIATAAVLKPSNGTLAPTPLIEDCMRRLGETGAGYIKLIENASDINDTAMINYPDHCIDWNTLLKTHKIKWIVGGIAFVLSVTLCALLMSKKCRK